MFISRKSGSNLFQQKSWKIFSSKQYLKITKKWQNDLFYKASKKTLLSQLLSTFVSGHCSKLGIFFHKKDSGAKIYYGDWKTAMF